MATGTDGQILSRKEILRINTKGRPSVNRDLGKRLLLSGYSTEQIATALKCGHKTVYRIRDELIAKGELTKTEIQDAGTPFIETDFDEECKRATGTSFKEFLKSKRKDYKRVFNFCANVWEQVWNKPALVLVKDPKNTLADQLVEKFNATFLEDNVRIRDRKKLIRYIFRFLGRSDINDKSLTMSNARDPRRVRTLPPLEMTDFPLRFKDCLNDLTEYQRLVVEFKLVTQMRTGKKMVERGLTGLRKNAGQSYLLMTDADNYRCHVLEKMNEKWDVTHIPKQLRDKLFAHYQTIADGEYIFTDIDKVLKRWRQVTKQHIGISMTLHDVRKVSVTWFFACGLPLEIATDLNVGWKDLNTPKDHYLHMRNILKKSKRAEYAANIPDWFKEGLDEYTED